MAELTDQTVLELTKAIEQANRNNDLLTRKDGVLVNLTNAIKEMTDGSKSTSDTKDSSSGTKGTKDTAKDTAEKSSKNIQRHITPDAQAMVDAIEELQKHIARGPGTPGGGGGEESGGGGGAGRANASDALQESINTRRVTGQMEDLLNFFKNFVSTQEGFDDKEYPGIGQRSQQIAISRIQDVGTRLQRILSDFGAGSYAIDYYTDAYNNSLEVSTRNMNYFMESFGHNISNAGIRYADTLKLLTDNADAGGHALAYYSGTVSDFGSDLRDMRYQLNSTGTNLYNVMSGANIDKFVTRVFEQSMRRGESFDLRSDEIRRRARREIDIMSTIAGNTGRTVESVQQLVDEMKSQTNEIANRGFLSGSEHDTVSAVMASLGIADSEFGGQLLERIQMAAQGSAMIGVQGPEQIPVARMADDIHQMMLAGYSHQQIIARLGSSIDFMEDFVEGIPTYAIPGNLSQQATNLRNAQRSLMGGPRDGTDIGDGMRLAGMSNYLHSLIERQPFGPEILAGLSGIAGIWTTIAPFMSGEKKGTPIEKNTKATEDLTEVMRLWITGKLIGAAGGMGRILGGMKGIIGGLSTSLGTLFTGLMAKMTGLIATIKGAGAASLGSGLMGKAGGLLGKAGLIGGALAGVLAVIDGGKNIIDGMNDAQERYYSDLSQASQGWSVNTSSILKIIGGLALAVGSVAALAVGSVPGAIGAAIAGFFLALDWGVKQFFDGVGLFDWIGRGVGWLRDNVWPKVVNWFSGVWQSIVGVFQNFWNFAKDNWWKLIPGLGPISSGFEMGSSASASMTSANMAIPTRPDLSLESYDVDTQSMSGLSERVDRLIDTTERGLGRLNEGTARVAESNERMDRREGRGPGASSTSPL